MPRENGIVRRNRGTHAFDSIMIGNQEIPAGVMFTDIFPNGNPGGCDVTFQVVNSVGAAIDGSFIFDVVMFDNLDGNGFLRSGTDITLSVNDYAEIELSQQSYAIKGYTRKDGEGSVRISSTTVTPDIYMGVAVAGCPFTVSRLISLNSGDYTPIV